MQRKMFIVFEQDMEYPSRVGDFFGPFYSWDRANALCKKLQTEHPGSWYGIRELLNGAIWMK